LGESRARLPVLSVPSGHRVLTGMLDRFPSIALKLKGADDPGEDWPAVVQVLDGERIAARLGREVFPMQLLLDDGPEAGYRRVWRAPNVTPEKNKGYAFQWFSHAALVAGYGAFWVINGGFRRNPRVDMK
jgi:cytochrome oxidase assembly protein ShyY1